MADPQLVLCGDVRMAHAPREWRDLKHAHALAIGDGPRDVHLEINQLSRAMSRGLSDLDADLLEVAAYVYTIDQVLTRGGTVVVDYGARWRRHLRLVIPVRCPGVWGQPQVSAALRAALVFLTDDAEWEFAFVLARDPIPCQRYVTDLIDSPDGTEFEEVVLFSGGLDSLCGAVDEVLVGQRPVVLVSHRSVSRIQARQDALLAALRERLPRSEISPLHVGATINKGRELNNEFSQRGRSFLFAAVAAVVARLAGRRRFRFYENGVTSLHLPGSRELVGARASRTTHPQTLHRFGALFSALFDGPFEVQNPYQWTTKAGMLRRLRAQGHADLCARTCSCGHVWGREERHPHCGRCSQCVDRRLTTVAAGLSDAEDPPQRYDSDVLTGERTGPELTLCERYVGSALDMEAVTDTVTFGQRYAEINDALPFTGRPAAEGARAIFELHRDHAAEVRGALHAILAARAEDLVRQSYPAKSLLGVIVGRVERTGDAPPAHAARRWIVERSRFEVFLDRRECFLGNSNEFRVVERLTESLGQYVSVETLIEDVWGNARTTRNTVQQTMSNIRRRFRDREFTGVRLDGSQAGFYRLVLGAEEKS
ncbi:winged helix-turn-helix domain-containing protein [Gemmata sp. G18]|uniref:Winged helix-turn-helix domain-containing protein n=1 Tax=Gemmata palustris TaxID=2822762 RepID=A0ABS5BME1_9BACT|nr:helix-turn-helix domain-containing protein [Gemmata palustris]MBP3954872.1 winged helix-turn-helix domain-containing protein [Gemmata palustris]